MTQVATTAEISNAIETVYGGWGLGHFNELAEERSFVSEGQLVAEFQQDPCSQHTDFFRHRGLLEGYAVYTLPGLLKEDGEVTVTQIGATGEETWSLATILNGARAAGSFKYAPFAIDGYNVNQTTLDKANGPFNTRLEWLQAANATWVGLPALRQCLEDTPEGVRPLPAMSERVTFSKHDILHGPVPGEKVVNTLVMNNVLYHYPEEAKNHIMANALAGLRPGGAFMFEGLTLDSRETLGHAEWVRNLDQYGIFPYHDRSVNSVYKYEPEKATKTFMQSAAVSEALVVLGAVRKDR